MEWINSHILSWLLVFPLIGAVIVLYIPERLAKFIALTVSIVVFCFSLKILQQFDSQTSAFQLSEKVSWIPSLGINYELGIDGISLWLVLLTTALMPIVILSAFHAVEKRERAFYSLLLALETGMLGAFFALDIFLFYVFWEAMLIPMYFLIGIWGGKERIYAALKFFIFTMAGSLLMLVAIFYLAYQHSIQFGSFQTSLQALTMVVLPGGGYFSAQSLLFLAFAVAFAIKVPLFPLHTWLPDAHVQAPTAGSVILAGVLLKMGGYGFLRFAFPLFPQAVLQYQNIFLILGSIAIVYGALVALVQPDIKKLVAYSSVSHMGYVIIGLFSLNTIGVNGALYQMLNHGIATPALFLLVGMIYERRHTRDISEFGGLAKIMPVFAVVLLVSTLSSVALPGTNGFVGEFMILLGTWQAAKLPAVIAASGVVLGAVYMLWMVQRVLYGPLDNPSNKMLKDLSAREVFVMVPLMAAIFAMGIYPKPFLSRAAVSVQHVIDKVQAAQPETVAQR